jgi:hypothetical protein
MVSSPATGTILSSTVDTGPGRTVSGYPKRRRGNSLESCCHVRALAPHLHSSGRRAGCAAPGGRMIRFVILYALAAVLTVPLAAQSLAPSSGQIPPEQRPPAGMCRIWIDGVPAGRQPAPTDCATAIRRRPPNARVIFGGDARGGRREPMPTVHSFSAPRREDSSTAKKPQAENPPSPPSASPPSPFPHRDRRDRKS